MRYVVIVEDGETGRRCFGTYRTFKAADRDARAVPNHVGKAYVLPVEKTEDLP